jgi:threonine synthase
MAESALSHLECSYCGETYNAEGLYRLCPACQSPLLARYDLSAAASMVTPGEIAERDNGMWRWREVLPVRETHNIVTLGEGGTPLIRADKLGEQLGLQNLFVKDESVNPTGTFKARGLSAAVSRALELGVTEFVIPTAGNAGGALAAYAARAGLTAHVYMPKDAPPVNIAEVSLSGSELVLVNGLIGDAGHAASEGAQANGWFDVSTLKEPYRLEGKKIMGYELALQFAPDPEWQWELPDVIIYPTGGGTGLVGMWKAFDELERLGWVSEERPRMVTVQAEGCAPIVRAFEEGTERAEAWENAQTIAAGLRVPSAVGDRLMLAALRESEGTAVAVSDEAILEAQAQLAAAEGIFAAPEGAASVAAARKLAADGWINPGERVVLFNTGTGMKYMHLLDRAPQESTA